MKVILCSKLAGPLEVDITKFQKYENAVEEISSFILELKVLRYN